MSLTRNEVELRPTGSNDDVLGRWDLAPSKATFLGITATVAIALAAGANPDHFSKATQALLLVLPVVATAVFGGRRAAVAVGCAATASLLLLLPPIGSPRIRLVEDVTALAAFAVVALVTGVLVAIRVDAMRRVERHHAALLRAVSHDLRTPLASIHAALSEIEIPGLHLETTRTVLASAAKVEAERLQRLVSDLLSLARIHSDTLRPDREPVDMVELVRTAADRLEFAAHHARLLIDAPEDLPVVQVDHDLFEQVVVNLLENAVRHTPATGVVTVSLSAGPDTLTLEVIDDGPGLLPEDVPLIFEAFRSGSRPGTAGVGLAICRAIVEAHSGTIEARNRPNGGASFRAVVPRG